MAENAALVLILLDIGLTLAFCLFHTGWSWSNWCSWPWGCPGFKRRVRNPRIARSRWSSSKLSNRFIRLDHFSPNAKNIAQHLNIFVESCQSQIKQQTAWLHLLNALRLLGCNQISKFDGLSSWLATRFFSTPTKRDWVQYSIETDQIYAFKYICKVLFLNSVH